MKLLTLFCTFACIIFGSSCTISYDPYYPGIYSGGYGDYRSGFSSCHPTYRYVPTTYCRPLYYHNSPYYR